MSLVSWVINASTNVHLISLASIALKRAHVKMEQLATKLQEDVTAHQDGRVSIVRNANAQMINMAQDALKHVSVKKTIRILVIHTMENANANRGGAA